jgi:fatty acid desaturase
MVRSRVAPAVLSLGLLAGALAVAVLQLAVLPLLLLPFGRAWGWLLLPLTLLTTPLWSVLHEAIHGGLFADRRRNDRAGRLLAIAYGAPFALLKSGHLMHHRYSRTRRERTEIYEPGRSRAAVAAGYFPRLLGGLWFAEVATVLLAAAPARVWRRAARRLDADDTVTGLVLDAVAGRHLRAFRLDSAAIVAVYAGSFWAYGARWWLLALSLLGRAVLISVADNAYHYGTRLGAPLEAMNLRLPRMLEGYVLAFNLHNVHHQHPGLPWYALRGAFVADADQYHLGWFAALGRQFRGPIPADRDDVRPLADADQRGGERVGDRPGAGVAGVHAVATVERVG